MRATLPFATALCLLLACATARARQPPPPPPQPTQGMPVVCKLCPIIRVARPESIPGPGMPVTFKAKVSGAGPSPSLTFMWVTSAGTFDSDQRGVINTPDAEREIVVDTTGMPRGGIVTATFEVGGLDRSCVNLAACTTNVPQPIEPHPTAFYGGAIRFEDEKWRLDNLAIELQNGPGFNGYIVCYGGRRGRRGEARARCERARRYPTTRRGIAPSRLVTVDGGFMEDFSVWLWALPPGTNFQPSPTVDPSEVVFTDAKGGARRRPARKRD